MKLIEPAGKKVFDIELNPGAPLAARVDDVSVAVSINPLPDGSMLINWAGGRTRAFAVRIGESFFVSIGPDCFEFRIAPEQSHRSRHTLATPHLSAPMPGKVLKIMVAEGEQVVAGQPLLTLEAMKMETTLNAEGPARVNRIAVAVGQMVDAGALLMELIPIVSSGSQSAP